MTYLPTTDPLIPTWDWLLPCSTGNIYITSCVCVNAALRIHLQYVYYSIKMCHVMCELYQAILCLFSETVFPRTSNKNVQCCNKLTAIWTYFACFVFFSFKAFIYNALVKQINVPAVGWNYSYKVQQDYCTGQISLCVPKVQRWQDFWAEIIDFVLISWAWSCLSQGHARVKLWSVHCDLLKAVCVCVWCY